MFHTLCLPNYVYNIAAFFKYLHWLQRYNVDTFIYWNIWHSKSNWYLPSSDALMIYTPEFVSRNLFFGQFGNIHCSMGRLSVHILNGTDRDEALRLYSCSVASSSQKKKKRELACSLACTTNTTSVFWEVWLEIIVFSSFLNVTKSNGCTTYLF